MALGQEKKDIRLEKYINELINCPSDGDGMSKQEVAISDSIKSVGAKAIPSLIKLLKNQKKKVRERASFILNGIDGVNESHLDALIASLRNGQTWHASRIAKIGTPKAIESLYTELVKDCESETQLTNSFVNLGAKGLPYLLRIIDCHNKCNEDLLYVVSSIYKELGEKAQSAVFKLDSLALSQTNSITSRKWAIICLGEIGVTANSSAKDLYELALNDSTNFKKVVIDALQNMKSPIAVLPLLERLKTSKRDFDKILILRDISEMGNNANVAGSSIIKYLKDKNWDIRIAAALTLGFIDYKPAVDELIETLNFEPNCKLNYVSAVALGKLKSKASIQSLRNVEMNHWYPPVQRAAKSAINYIEDSTQVPKSKRKYTFPEIFFAYENFGLGIPRCKLDSCSKENKLPFSSGYLVGTDRGEFGGELKFIDSEGNESLVLHDNIKSLYSINGKTIAIAGLAHMDSNSGSIYQITEKSNGTLSVELILALPAAPIETKRKSSGEILINTYGGTIELTNDLKLKICNCNLEKKN